MIWQDRFCKIVDGCFMMSAVGRHDDFNFAPAEISKEQAIAGVLPSDDEFDGGREPKNMMVVDDNRLLFLATDGSLWLLTGNPMDGGRFDRLGVLKEMPCRN